MKDKTFEDFLKEWHMRDYQGTDDDAPDAFDSWVSNLEVETVFILGNVWGRECHLRGYDKATNKALEIIKTI